MHGALVCVMTTGVVVVFYSLEASDDATSLGRGEEVLISQRIGLENDPV